MPGDMRRRWHARQRRRRGRATRRNKCNGMTLRRRRQPARLRARHQLGRARWTRRHGGREIARLPLRGQASSTARTTSSSSRDGTIYFTDPTYGRMPGFGIEREQELDFQGVYRIAPGAAASSQLLDRRVRPAERPVLLARRVAALHQRHRRARTSASSTSRATARSANGRVFAEGIGTGDSRRRARRRHEVRRARQRLGHRAAAASGCSTPQGEHLGVDRGARERRQRQLGRRGLADAVHRRLDLAVPRPAEGRRQPTRLHAADDHEETEMATSSTPRARADHPGPAERRDHRGRRVRRLGRAGARQRAERRRQRRGARRRLPRGRRRR